MVEAAKLRDDVGRDLRRAAEPVPIVPPALAPGHLLRRAQQVHTELWATRVEGLTGPQYATLVAIAGWDDVDQRRAGQLASLDKSTVAEVVRRLVDKGWVRRVRDPHDGRRRLLTLVDGSRERLAVVTEAARSVQSDILAPSHRPAAGSSSSGWAGWRARAAGDAGVRLSVGRKGQCWDNAVAESFFATIKTELLDRQPWPTKTKAHKVIFEYVEGWYNTRRRHSSLGYLSPAAYEANRDSAASLQVQAAAFLGVFDLRDKPVILYPATRLGGEDSHPTRAAAT